MEAAKQFEVVPWPMDPDHHDGVPRPRHRAHGHEGIPGRGHRLRERPAPAFLARADEYKKPPRRTARPRARRGSASSRRSLRNNPEVTGLSATARSPHALPRSGRRSWAAAASGQPVGLGDRRPAPAGLLLSLGSADFRSGRIADAEREYRAAIAAQPKLGEARVEPGCGAADDGPCRRRRRSR